jgi:hypothetical protein
MKPQTSGFCLRNSQLSVLSDQTGRWAMPWSQRLALRKFVNGGKLQQETIDSLQGSIEPTSLWDRWVVRKSDDGYELAAGGHHLLQARSISTERSMKYPFRLKIMTMPECLRH